MDRTGPMVSVRFDSVSNRSVPVGIGPVQTEVVHTCPEPTLRFGTVLETRGCVLPTMHLTRPRYVEQIQSHGCFEGWMVWRYHRLKHTKAWLRVILVDDFLWHTLCRDLSYEIQETLSISDIILRLLANQVWRGSAFYPQLNHQNNSYFEGYTTR